MARRATARGGSRTTALPPPELRELDAPTPPPDLLELGDVRGDLHVHTTASDGKATVEEMGRAAQALGYEYLAICDHTRNVRVVPGLDADDLRRQAEEIAAANEVLAPFRILRGSECDILPDGSLDLPDDVLARARVGADQPPRRPARAAQAITDRVVEAMRHPAARCLSHPKGRILNHRPENALDLERVFEVALETGVAVEVNGLPDRLDLSGAHVREALAAGVPIVCSTDAHSVRGLGNMPLSVLTARRGARAPRRRPQHAVAGGAPRPLTGREPGPRSAYSCTSYQCVPRSAVGHLGIRVADVEDVVLEVAADRDVAERDVGDARQHLDGQLRLGDGVVHELEVGSELHQVGPVGTCARAHRSTEFFSAAQLPSSRTTPRSSPAG